MNLSKRLSSRSLSLQLGPSLNALKSVFQPTRRATRAANTQPRVPYLDIPCCDDTAEERAQARYFNQGQMLARQDRWDELARLISAIDHQRLATPGGTPVVDVLAKGARADIMQAARDAVRRDDVQRAVAPLAALDEIQAEHVHDYGIALVVAQAHIEMGWEWRGMDWAAFVPMRKTAAFHEHFRTAARIIGRFDPFELDAPALAAARCSLLPAEQNPSQRVADDYEDMIDLDPRNPRHMRDLGKYLLPRWFGSYEQLELEARRTAGRTRDIWGAGAYAWVHLDALAIDPAVFEILDAEYFVEGLHDIVARCPDQHTINLLSAFTGFTLADTAATGKAHGRVSGCFDWIVRDHLREVHPLVWAAAGPIDDSAPCTDKAETAARGRARALTTLTAHFAPDIRRDRTIRFQRDGLRIVS